MTIPGIPPGPARPPAHGVGRRGQLARRAVALVSVALAAGLPSLLWRPEATGPARGRRAPSHPGECCLRLELPEKGFWFTATGCRVQEVSLRSVAPAPEATWAQKSLVYATPLLLIRARLEWRARLETAFDEYCLPDGARPNYREARALDGREIAVALRRQKLYVFVDDEVGVIPVEVDADLRVSLARGRGTITPSDRSPGWNPSGLPRRWESSLAARPDGAAP